MSARTLRIFSALSAAVFLAGCSSNQFARQVDPRYGVASSPRVIADGSPIPKGGGVYRIGKPYQVAGRMYVPDHDPAYTAEGIASWYGADFHGRLTANGEIYDKDAITAAHKTMPLPSYARVTNLSNGRSIIVRVNDRGPYAKDREIDLSARAAELLNYKMNGVARVRVEYVGPAPLEGTDDRNLLATLRQNQPAPAPSTVLVASNSPYIPVSPEADARSASAIRVGYTPVPAERPYDLGRFSTPPGEDPQPSASMKTANAKSAVIAAGYSPSAQSSSLGFASGRGLY